MQIGTLTFTLTPVSVLTLVLLILSVVEVIRTWGVTTRPLSFAVFVLALLQLLWLLGLIPLPGAAPFQNLAVWLAITDAALVPVSVALAWMAAGRLTVPIASALGLLAFVQFLIVTGIMPVQGLM